MGESIPLWLKLAYTTIALVVLVVYYVRRGPQNFLWLSDIALILLVPALWLESAFLASVAAVMVLLPELAWTLSFFGRLATGRSVIGLADYMFEEHSPRWLRALSLFHLPLVVVLVWLVWQLGYSPGALPWAVALVWVVLPVTYLLTDEADNVNWVHRIDVAWARALAPWQRLVLLMIALPVALQLPTHLLLVWLFA